MDIKKLKLEYPLISSMANYQEILWLNDDTSKKAGMGFSIDDIEDADMRLRRFAPYLAKAFPETEGLKGIIESPLIEIPNMKSFLEDEGKTKIKGRVFLKCDSHLPISGSVKARGGIYEVLKFAEEVALKEGLLKEGDDYSLLLKEPCREVFEKYSVAVGSTGNLGLSIGIMSRVLGFKTEVHMSKDAREWKKELLREKGATVVEYDADYQLAVAEGRKKAQENPMCHFVDDENSADLFMGYAVAAKRLKVQLEREEIKVDKNHPLFVYIPCGVGGAPGGIAFGLNRILGPNVYCFFAEPTHAPCMTLGLMTKYHDEISVRDIGIDGITEADGLAVGRPSKLVGSIMENILDGCFTVDDDRMFAYLAKLFDSQDIFIEPSACAGFLGPSLITNSKGYLAKNDLADKLGRATHIIWATGGKMVPKEEAKKYYIRGKEQLKQED